MCSIRWLSPAWGSDSPTEPVPIHTPRATERTESMRSVTTRRPPSSVVSRCPSPGATGSVAPGVGTGCSSGLLATLGVAPAAATRAVTRAAGAAVAAVAAALAVDLDHAHLDLVALVQDVLDRVDALAGRDVADVQQAVGALGELDE